METIFTLDQVEQIAKKIIEETKKNNEDKATILAFSGDLGVGKTTITKEIARQLGVEEHVISPTFVIMKKYQTKDSQFKNLIHIDAYRFNKSEEILSLGLEESFQNKNNFIIIEWSEIVSDHLPKGTYNIKLEHKDDTTRSIKIWS